MSKRERGVRQDCAIRSIRRRTIMVRAAGLGAIAGLVALPGAEASGFRVPPMSAAGLGLANALVAESREPGAVPYNPAAIAFYDRWQASGGVVLIDNKISVDNAAGSSTSDTTNPTAVPHGFIQGPIADRFRFGVVIDAPYGQETNWPVGTFPFFQGPIAGLAPTRSKINLVSVNPSVVWQATPTTGIALGADYYNLLKARLDSTGTKLSGDGDAWGFSAALMHVAGPWTFGVSYHSSAEVDVSGNLESPFATSGARTKLRLPARAQAGVQWRFRPDMGLEVDLDYTGWSRFRDVTIEHADPVLPSPIVNTSNWKDTVAVRVGWTNHVRPDTTLRLGYAYERSASPSEHFSPRNPDARTNSFSAGIGQTFGRFKLDAGYMYVRYETRSVDSSVPFGTVYGFDPNGTLLFNGTYHERAHLFALSGTLSF